VARKKRKEKLINKLVRLFADNERWWRVEGKRRSLPSKDMADNRRAATIAMEVYRV